MCKTRQGALHGLFVVYLSIFCLAVASAAQNTIQYPAGKLKIAREVKYSGLTDASAGVAVSSNLFLVADDEQNILRLYRNDKPGPPIKEFDLNGFLEVRGKSLEADLEGAAQIGDRAYWIGSHGRNKDGKQRPNRCRLFATDIRISDGEVSVVPVGRPCKRLLEDLLADPLYQQFHFAEASLLAPKEEGAFNIEGLSATPNGQLLIGLRNPVPAGKALIIPLLNPGQIITNGPCRFGKAIALDLGGLGIRDIALHGTSYFIIAGPWHGGTPFRFYRWGGTGTTPEGFEVKHLKDYHPEGIVIYPEKGLSEVQILSDDGKEVQEFEPKSFRSFWLVSDPPK